MNASMKSALLVAATGFAWWALAPDAPGRPEAIDTTPIAPARPPAPPSAAPTPVSDGTSRDESPAAPVPDGRGLARIAVSDPDGRPAEGVTFSLLSDDGRTVTAFDASPESPGVYLAALEPGRVKITAHRDGRSARHTTVDVAEGRTTRVELVLAWALNDVESHARAGEIAGRLFTRETGKALSSKEVQFSIRATPARNVAGMAAAGEDGRFRFRGLEPGSYEIVALPLRRNHWSALAKVTLPAAANKEGVEIGLSECASGTVKLVVRDGAGKPVERAEFMTVKDDGSRRSSTTCLAATSEPGVYFLELEAGPATLYVRREGLEPAETTLEVATDRTLEAKIVLRPGGEKRCRNGEGGYMTRRTSPTNDPWCGEGGRIWMTTACVLALDPCTDDPARRPAMPAGLRSSTSALEKAVKSKDAAVRVAARRALDAIRGAYR